jgi:hypothetical protein
VIVNDALRTLAEDYFATTALREIPPTTSESQYVSALISDLRTADNQVEADIPSIRRILIQLRSATASDDHDEVELHWSRFGGHIFDRLASARVRNRLGVDPSVPDTVDVEAPEFSMSNGLRLAHVNLDESKSRYGKFESLVLVLGHGSNPEFIISNWAVVHRASLLRLGIGVATVVAAKDRDTQLRLLSEVGRILDSHEQASKDYAQAVRSELDRFRRFVVNGTLSNGGRSSCSIQTRAALFIRFRDYPTPDGQRLTEDSRIDLTLKPTGSPEGEDANTGPALMKAGEARSFKAISHRPVKEIPSTNALMAAFLGGTVMTYLATVVTGLSKSATSCLYSPEILFRDFDQAFELKPKDS